MNIFGKGKDHMAHFENERIGEHDETFEIENFDRESFFDENYKEYKHVSELSFGIDCIP